MPFEVASGVIVRTQQQNLVFALKLIQHMKNQRLYLRVTEETKQIAEKKAKKYKTTLSYYIISLIRNKSVKVQALPDKNALKLKQELNAIGKNLWLIIKFNKAIKLEEKEILEDLIQEIKETIKIITDYYDSKNYNG